VPITPTMNDRTVTLNGHDLTIDQIVMVARYGAKVELSAEARHAQAENFGLLLEAAAEGIPVYWFNRGAGDQRETVMFEGDPLSPKNHAMIEKTQEDRFRSGALWGTGPGARWVRVTWRNWATSERPWLGFAIGLPRRSPVLEDNAGIIVLSGSG